MSNAANLLRMLEPPVRPDGLAGAPRGAQPTTPIESQSFDAVLRQAQAMADEQVTQTDDEAEQANIGQASRFTALGGLDRIDNATLRELIARAAKDDGQ